MNTTTLTLYRNTPLVSLQKTIHFKSNADRDNHFNTKYEKLDIPGMNIIRDRLTIKVPSNVKNFEWLSAVNYARFWWEGQYIYMMIKESTYANGNVTIMNGVIDGVMTYLQGDFSTYLSPVNIKRQHLTEALKTSNKSYLLNNGDVLNFGGRKVVAYDTYKFGKLGVILSSKYDLKEDFGKEDNPKMVRPTGGTYDKVTSPLNLYYVTQDNFKGLMEVVQEYAWVADNITKVTLVPDAIIDKDDLQRVSMKTGSFGELYTFTNNANSIGLGTILKKSKSEFLDLLGNYRNDLLLRSAYVNVEMTNYQGQKVELLPELMDNQSMNIQGDTLVGYNNSIAFYDARYGGTQYIDNAIIFNNWDTVPVLVDQGSLAISKSANQIKYAESNTMTGKVDRVMDNDNSLTDRFVAGAGLLSNVSPKSLIGGIKDESEFYRRQSAEFADKRLASPSIGEQDTGNAFSVKQDKFGITVRYSRIPMESLAQVARYHGNYGYEWNRFEKLSTVQNMPKMNYVKFEGDIILSHKSIPIGVQMQLKAQFEAGVQLWHDNGSANPFNQVVGVDNM